MTIYKCCIEVEVTDVAKLAATALHHLTYKDGVDSDDANEMIYPEGPGTDPDIEACLIAIFDPGSSPSGTEIRGSFTE
jgi:hypothetical protein